MIDNEDDNDDILQDTNNGNDQNNDIGTSSCEEFYDGENDNDNNENGRSVTYSTRRITAEEYKREGMESKEAFEAEFKRMIPLVEHIRRTKIYREIMVQSAREASTSSGAASSMFSSARRNDRRFHSSSSVKFKDDDGNNSGDDSDDNLSDSQTINLFKSHRRDADKRRSGNPSRRNSIRRNTLGNIDDGRSQRGSGLCGCDSIFGIIFMALSLGYLFYTYAWVGKLSCYNTKDNFKLVEIKCFDKVIKNIENGETYPLERDPIFDNTYLHKAAEVGGVEFAEKLVKRYPELVDMINFANDTALHIAVRNGHINFVRFLLLHDANCTAVNKHDKIPKDGSKTGEMDRILEDLCKRPQEQEPESKPVPVPVSVLGTEHGEYHPQEDTFNNINKDFPNLELKNKN